MKNIIQKKVQGKNDFLAGEAQGDFERFIKGAGVILLLIAIVAALSVSFLYGWSFSWKLSDSHERWAQFGDFIGGTLNPVFGFVSLMAILITLFVQSRELSHSTRALQDQGESLKVQAFENTFFSLLKIINETSKNTSVEEGDYVGAAAFRHLWRMLKDSYSFYSKKDYSSDDAKVIKDAYLAFYSSNQDGLDHFIRNAVRIIEVIISRCPGSEVQYVRILVSQMSSYQLSILFYHLYVKKEGVPTSFLKNSFLFETLPDKMLINPEMHQFIKEEVC